MTKNHNAEVRLLAQALLHKGLGPLTDRERRMIERIARRVNVRDLNEAVDAKTTIGERMADRVAALGGSWRFISGFCLFLVAWAVLNAVILGARAFDPYPFVFLNLLLSMLAALQAPIIMMSQNRQASKDRLAAALDYEVNLKSEVEIMALHEKLDRLQSRIDDLLAERAGTAPGVAQRPMAEAA